MRHGLIRGPTHRRHVAVWTCFLPLHADRLVCRVSVSLALHSKPVQRRATDVSRRRRISLSESGSHDVELQVNKQKTSRLASGDLAQLSSDEEALLREKGAFVTLGHSEFSHAHSDV